MEASIALESATRPPAQRGAPHELNPMADGKVEAQILPRLGADEHRFAADRRVFDDG